MATINISDLTALIQGLSDRVHELKYEFENLYIKVELTLDTWHKIEALYQAEGWDTSRHFLFRK